MRLYVGAASHPCYAVEAALRLKGLAYDRVVLPIGLSAPFQLVRFGRRTLHIGSSLVALRTSEDLQPLIEGRLANRLLADLSPEYPGHMPAGTIRVPADTPA
jgi:hypothetical protein